MLRLEREMRILSRSMRRRLRFTTTLLKRLRRRVSCLVLIKMESGRYDGF